MSKVTQLLSALIANSDPKYPLQILNLPLKNISTLGHLLLRTLFTQSHLVTQAKNLMAILILLISYIMENSDESKLVHTVFPGLFQEVPKWSPCLHPYFATVYS